MPPFKINGYMKLVIDRVTSRGVAMEFHLKAFGGFAIGPFQIWSKKLTRLMIGDMLCQNPRNLKNVFRFFRMVGVRW